MTENPRWITALLAVAVPILVVGSLAWVFPRETAGVAGPWALPVLSLSALFLALGLAVEWRILRGLLVVLAVTLVLGWNRPSATSTSHFAGACFGFLVMLIIGRAIVTPRRLRLAMLTFLAGGLVMLVLGLAAAIDRTGTLVKYYSAITVPPWIQLGLAGLDRGYVNANALAAAALLVAPLGMSVLVLRTGEKVDWLGLLPVAFAVVVTGAVTLAICHSRTAWVVIWLILVGLLARGMRAWLFRVLIGAMVVVPLFGAVASTSLLNQEAFVTEARNFWISAQGRADIVSQGVERWKKSPWFGIGLNEFRTVYQQPQYLQPPGGDVAHAHNIFLQTALDVGVVGSAAYWGILVFLWVRAGHAAGGLSRLGRSAAVGSALSLVTITLFGLADAVPLGSKVGMFQWMAGGLILAAWRMQSRSSGQAAG